MKHAIIFSLCLVLAACSAAVTPAPACPHLRTYSLSQQKAIAAEVDRLPANTLLTDPLTDWALMRNETRKCLHAG